MHNLLQLSASRPEGPAAPFMCRAADLMAELSKASKTTGCMSGGSALVMDWVSMGWLGGCLSTRTSRTFLVPLPMSMESSK